MSPALILEHLLMTSRESTYIQRALTWGFPICGEQQKQWARETYAHVTKRGDSFGDDPDQRTNDCFHYTYLDLGFPVYARGSKVSAYEMVKKIHDKAGPQKKVVESFKKYPKEIKLEINLERIRNQGSVARLGNFRLCDIAPERALQYTFVSRRHKKDLREGREARNLDLEEERHSMQEHWTRLQWFP
jgi:hypothetical protein